MKVGEVVIMEVLKMKIENVPVILLGKPSEGIYVYVPEKGINQYELEEFAVIAEEQGYQTLRFDYEQRDEKLEINQLSVLGEFAFDNWEKVSLFVSWAQQKR